MIKKIVGNHIGIASIAPKREISKGESNGMIGICLIMSFHMALNIAAAENLPRFQAHPHLSLGLAYFARIGILDSFCY
jgi:hypothetical protein